MAARGAFTRRARRGFTYLPVITKGKGGVAPRV